MAILLRSRGGNWEKVAKIEFRNEVELQQLLYGSPELVGGGAEGHVAVFTRECSLPGSGYTDLIGVDTNGTVMIVESKLARNREIRRTVIGQIVEYASFLWRMSFEEFDHLFVAREGRSALDLLEERAPEIDREAVRKRITENLMAGDFDLLIVVDAINPELEKIIAYLSSRDAGLKFEALEVEAYKRDAIEVLVPKRHGQISPATSAKSARRTLSVQEILANCENEHSRTLFSLAEANWGKLGHTVVPGTVGASFRAVVKGQEQPIFWAYPDSLQAAFNVLAKGGAPPHALRDYRNSISQLKGFNAPKILRESQPITKWSNVDAEAVLAFLAESQRLVERWKNSEAPPMNLATA